MNKYCIIAGTEKAATTSLYSALYNSGQFSTSEVKELDYLRKFETDLVEYNSKFHGTPESIKLEASPGYLSEPDVVSKNINSLGLNNELFIFVLRSPIKKIISSFKFHQTRLDISKNITFDEYISLCLDDKTDSRVIDWCLQVPKHTLYYKNLMKFYDAGCENVVVYEFDYLTKNFNSCVNEIFERNNIDFFFEETVSDKPSNVTRAHGSDTLQKLALFVNKKGEKFFRKNKVIKNMLLKVYFKFNSGTFQKIKLSEMNKKRLFNLYQEDILNLENSNVINSETARKWLNDLNEIEVI